MNKIRELIDKLNYYTKLYDEGKPKISDKEWDDLYFELVALENKYKIYYEDSPTQRVNYEVKNELQKVTHNHPMLSLDKTKDLQDIKDFIGEKSFICMSKMDGLTCSLKYRNGKLIGAETRGNGEIGEDILHNALVVKNIPKRIPFTDGELTVDGEIICTYKDFEPFATEYKNPRNFASGSIRLLDSKECASRNLSFVAWDAFGDEFRDDFLSEKLYELETYGFTIVPFDTNNLKYNTTGKSLEETVNRIKEKGKDYPTDGLVFKYDTTDEYEEAGRTDHHFKGGLALKFYDDEYETTLKDIEWTMGRTGVLTPVAILEPVEIDGTEISRASLHNLSILNEFEHQGLRIGCKVAVFKANMIIPQIARVIPENPDLDFTSQEFGVGLPSICPICGSHTEIRKDNNSKMLYCGNPNCQGKSINIIDHMCGKKGLDIKGLSKATIEKLINWGWIKNKKDIFELKRYREEWIKKPGFGPASVDKILGAIDMASETTLDKIIAATGIPEIGSRVAKDLASHYATWTDFRSETNFMQYDGIGEVMNNNLLSFDYTEMDEIVEQYLIFEKNNVTINTENENNKLKNLIIVITGKLNNGNRDTLKQKIESLGGKVTGSVSSKTSLLINNDIESNSIKNQKAKELGIQIITEEDFYKKYLQ